MKVMTINPTNYNQKANAHSNISKNNITFGAVEPAELDKKIAGAIKNITKAMLTEFKAIKKPQGLLAKAKVIREENDIINAAESF